MVLAALYKSQTRSWTFQNYDIKLIIDSFGPTYKSTHCFKPIDWRHRTKMHRQSHELYSEHAKGIDASRYTPATILVNLDVYESNANQPWKVHFLRKRNSQCLGNPLEKVPKSWWATNLLYDHKSTTSFLKFSSQNPQFLRDAGRCFVRARWQVAADGSASQCFLVRLSPNRCCTVPLDPYDDLYNR